MPSFLLLLVMSLAVASHQAHDKSRPTVVAAKLTETKAPAVKAIQQKTVALADTATAPPAIAILTEAALGLSVQSEIDAPIIVKYWSSEKLELGPLDVAALVEQSESASVETKTVGEFFKNSVFIQDWMSDDEKAMARKFREFVVTLEAQLENPRVYLFGERERTVIIIGKVKGGFGGVVTLVVET